MIRKLVFVLTGLAFAQSQDVKAFMDVDYEADGAQNLKWAVEVYEYSNGQPQHSCGGSLVTPTAVISAARCFWAKGEQKSASNLVVARTYGGIGVGTDWNTVQTAKVRTIHLPLSYKDSEGLYANDIAVLILEEPMRGVMPICINFDKVMEEKHLTEGNFGRNMGTLQLAGYGLPSPLFTALEVPYVPEDRCKQYSDLFREQLTADKICTGFKPGPGNKPESLICRGDHGSGLVFYSGTEWNAIPYLRGVASTPFPGPTGPYGTYSSCSTYRYAAFTRISSHRRFLEHHLPGIEDKCAQYYKTNTVNIECDCNCKNNTTSE
ncbi:modular serine protease-like [Leguminivora glycinivorella]|uniref:modular serine protease-like n=1 Tax=Leguminivora glycinivorella TaxID=1035111 RepID=UPI00200E0330|nr:modular serine protease-like [Leguminivora glycinivorella]